MIRNSCLQCLIHLKDFVIGYTEFVEKNNHICANNKLLCQFNKILENIKFAFFNNSNYIRINDFYLFYTKEFNTNFIYNTEQDSLEFTRNLIENLAKCLIIPKNNSFYANNNKKVNYIAKTDRNLGFQVQEYEEFLKLYESPLIIDIFYGLSLTEFSCIGCGKVTYKHEHFLDIPLYFGKF